MVWSAEDDWGYELDKTLIQSPQSPFARLPYGETIFNKATGRCSNGLLMIDYIALSAGVPLLDAYLNLNATHSHGHGVNFAVAGSTALPVECFIREKDFSPRDQTLLSTHSLTGCSPISMKPAPNSMKATVMRNLKGLSSWLGRLEETITIMHCFKAKPSRRSRPWCPDVVQAIKDAATRVIENGARRVIIPGNFPNWLLPNLSNWIPNQ
ncbi:hypothetical protein Pint_19758 [Pistacia integerrima]|uniref:Uncharacterized protein n=1 Tax=Pistacia integerrima TaxID=434235 RepID=A0ACC0XCG6_9ROSI|nr:hypothetical protein Pint_19758 [Pistacia integerrima]